MCFLAYVVPTKRCARCANSYPWAEFVFQRHSRDGMGSWCRSCRNTHWNQRYALKAPERALKAAARKQERERLKALTPKIKKPRNAEKHRKANATYRQRHPEKIRETERKARPKYLDKHPELRRIVKSRYRARKQNLPDTFTVEQWAFALSYWGNCCAICSCQESFWTTFAADHWIPLSSSTCPGTIAQNILPLCHGTNGCNNSKNDSEPHAWLLRRFGASKTAKLEKAITAYFAIVAEHFQLL